MFDWITDVRNFFGSNSEFVESVQIAAQDRIASPFYGYFLISWLLINWRIPYAAFFLDQEKLYEKTNLLRLDYLNTLIPSHLTWSFFFNFLVYPFLLTCFFFWVSPHLTRFFFRKHIRNKKALKVIELEEQRQEREKEKELVKAETSLLAEKTQRARQQKRAATEAEQIWDDDFEDFTQTRVFKKFQKILDAIYLYSGHISWGDFQVDPDLLVYADTNELIKINNSNNTITLTDKGKYFVKRFSEL